jgi:hypothetical protein
VVDDDVLRLEDLPAVLRARVQAAAGHARRASVEREGAGYRAQSGDSLVDMYLEVRADGSVEEQTSVTGLSEQ